MTGPDLGGVAAAFADGVRDEWTQLRLQVTWDGPASCRVAAWARGHDGLERRIDFEGDADAMLTALRKDQPDPWHAVELTIDADRTWHYNAQPT